MGYRMGYDGRMWLGHVKTKPLQLLLVCQSSLLVVCQSSLLAVCQSSLLVVCQSSLLVVCQSSLLVVCQSSLLVVLPICVHVFCFQCRAGPGIEQWVQRSYLCCSFYWEWWRRIPPVRPLLCRICVLRWLPAHIWRVAFHSRRRLHRLVTHSVQLAIPVMNDRK